MCSSGGEIAKTDEAIQKANAATSSALTADYTTAFAAQQNVLNQQYAKLRAIAANPMGYTPAQLATATTSINERTSTAAKQAIGAAAAYAAGHGGADVGSGVSAMLAGQVASEAGQSKAQQLSDLSMQNEDLKQKNFWNAINGLSGVGSEFGNAASTAIGGANETANTSVNAGTSAENVKMAGLQAFGGILSGIGGLASAGVGAYTASKHG